MLRFAFSKTCVALSLSRAVVLRNKKDSHGSHTQGPAAVNAGWSTAKVAHKGVGGALPTVVSPLPTAGVIPSKSGAGCNQTASGAPDALADAYAGFKDFLDPEKISAKPVATEAEKASLRQIAKDINDNLPEGDLEKMVNTADTLTLWRRALPSGNSLTDSKKTETAVRDFAASAFKKYPFPDSEDDRLALVQKVLKFVDASLFRGVLEVHIDNVLRGRTQAIKDKLDMSPCPILCRDTRIKICATKLSIVDEWAAQSPLSPAGDPAMDASKQIQRIALSQKLERTKDHPIAIGGDSGSGKTIFSVLAPGHLLAGKRVSDEDIKRSALVIYGYASEVDRPIRNTISAVDAALQRAKDEKAENVDDLRKERNDAASAFLQSLVGAALNWKGVLTLPDEKMYAHLFIVVDELSSEREVFRSLLVGGKEQQYILSFAEKFAHETQLICCATGGRSVLDPSGTSLGNYDAVHMGPSKRLFQLLLRQGGTKDEVIEGLLGNWILAAVVKNRRIATYAAETHLGKGITTIKPKSEKRSDLVEHASSLAEKAIQRYVGVNALRDFSQRAATAIMLEALRRLLLWDPEAQPDVGKLFEFMGSCSPLTLGTFSEFQSEKTADGTNTTHKEFWVVVTTAQLVIAALRYGASSAIMQATPTGFESMSAHMFVVFLDAMRVVARWDGSEEDRVFCLEKTHHWPNEKTLREFASALRGTEAVPPVSLAAFLRALDGKWMCGVNKKQLSNSDAVDPEEVKLTHSSVELPEELPHKLQPGTEEHAQEFELTFKEMQTAMAKGAAVVMLNTGEACYADFIGVCGDVLFLARCKDCPTVCFGETDEVREELARMGFMSADGAGDSFPAKTESENWEEYAALTHSLMKTFGCRIAVPLFYLSEHTSDVQLSPKGREVIAAGHGWRGPVPFVRISATVEKYFLRKKIAIPTTCSSPPPATGGVTAAAPGKKAANHNTTQRKKSAPKRGAAAPPKKRTKSRRFS